MRLVSSSCRLYVVLVLGIRASRLRGRRATGKTGKQGGGGC